MTTTTLLIVGRFHLQRVVTERVKWSPALRPPSLAARWANVARFGFVKRKPN